MILDISEFNGTINVLVEGTHDKKGLTAILRREGVLRGDLVIAGLYRALAVAQSGNTFGIRTWREARLGDDSAQEITVGKLRRV